LQREWQRVDQTTKSTFQMKQEEILMAVGSSIQRRMEQTPCNNFFRKTFEIDFAVLLHD
jgi:hypothetical protein